MLRARLAWVAAGSLLAALAWAQFRTLPDDAKRGNVAAVEMPLLQIGGTTYHVAPGAIIRDENNRIITPNFLAVGADVAFAFDMNGDVNRIFVLTAQERDQLNNR